jgi:hypothetical protein
MSEKGIEDKIQELDDKLISDREKWSKRILEMIQGLKQMDQLVDSQVNMLSYRHMLVDHITEIQALIYKKKAIYENKYKEKYIDRKSTRLNSSHLQTIERSRMPSSA